MVIATANRGQADTRLLIGGGAAAAFNFRRLDGAAQGAGVDGLGRNEPAFVQSEVGPFTVEEGANFAFVLNNGAAGIALAHLVVSCTTAALWEPAAGDGRKTARCDQRRSGSGGAGKPGGRRGRERPRDRAAGASRQLLHPARQGRRLLQPNVRLGFSTDAQSGFGDGDFASADPRPGFNVVAGVNEPRPLAGGDDGSPVTNFDLVGTADRKTGMHALDDVTDVNFIAVPVRVTLRW